MTINNNNIFGAFTLGEVRSGRLTGDWLNKESVANYGWFGGGAVLGPASTETVSRIDFSNDSATASTRGLLSSSRYDLAATGNSNYGWFGGGTNFIISAARLSRVDRVDFSNDSSTALVRGPLSTIRQQLSATGNSNYGWFGGGYDATVPAPARVQSTVDRIDFSNDSATASVRSPLSRVRRQLAATGNSNYGWFGGGAGPLSTVDRIDFSNDFSTASPRGPLSLVRDRLAATGNSNYGWFGGGTTPAPLTFYSTVNRIDFSNDSSTASVRGSFITPKRNLAATGNSNYGWFGGGYTTGPTITATVERIDFSNDSSTASPRGALSSVVSNLAATSGVLNIRRQKAGNFGWFGGGQVPAVSAVVDRIDFSNDSVTASARGPLFQARWGLAATGNSNFGWFGGGYVPGTPTGAPVSTVDRIDFSNDAATASPRGPLSLIRFSVAATGNSNYGWFGGGYSSPAPGFRSIVNRIDFSNDSSTASPRGSLNAPGGRSNFTATGNSNYGWFGGGTTSGPLIVATVDRIDFSNDSTSALTRGPLNSPKNNLAATGNSNYGWFGGGNPGPLSTVDRIDFSNDSVSASPRGLLNAPAGRQQLAATGNSNYGWFGGGNPLVSTVNRIDFSNDSVTASVRGSITPATGRQQLAATSNTPIG